MQYTVVDLNTWERGKLFSHYIDKMRIVMSLTSEIDAAPLVAYLHKHKLKFYPAMIWVVSKVINAHAEFKYGWDENGQLIRWDFVSPYYVHFHPEDENFTKLVTEYTDDLHAFHAKFLEDKETYKDARWFDVTDIPRNTFDLTCLPWMRYTHYDLHVFDEGKYLAPVVAWGKYEKVHGKLKMPLTMNIHHAVADGFHVARFFREVQECINELGASVTGA